jgi:hypothetical protein
METFMDPITEQLAIQAAKKRKARWDAIFYDCPGSWYGSDGPGTEYIIVDIQRTVDAVNFLRQHRVKILATGQPINDAIGYGGIRIEVRL